MENSGVREALNTFALSVGVVAVYYGILAIWFWNMTPTEVTKAEGEIN